MTTDGEQQQGPDDVEPAEPPRRNMSWDHMSPTQKRAVVVAGAAQMALMAAAQVDLLRRPADDVRGPKPAWFAANFVNVAGPISYFVLGRRRQSR